MVLVYIWGQGVGSGSVGSVCDSTVIFLSNGWGQADGSGVGWQELRLRWGHIYLILCRGIGLSGNSLGGIYFLGRGQLRKSRWEVLEVWVEFLIGNFCT